RGSGMTPLLREPVVDDAVARAIADDRRVPAAEATPRRPEEQGRDEADQADDQQDDADRVDVEAGDGRVDRPDQHGAGGGENESEAETHFRTSCMRGLRLMMPSCPGGSREPQRRRGVARSRAHGYSRRRNT